MVAMTSSIGPSIVVRKTRPCSKCDTNCYIGTFIVHCQERHGLSACRKMGRKKVILVPLPDIRYFNASFSPNTNIAITITTSATVFAETELLGNLGDHRFFSLAKKN